MSGTHSVIPPSSAARRVQCPASRMMEARHPDTASSEVADEGTASHELAALLIYDYAKMPTCQVADKLVGLPASNGVIWTQESYESARQYADHVRSVMQSTGCFAPHIEERISNGRIHPDSWGTPDCWLFDKVAGVMHVWDYKFGHKVVEAFDNWQLITYTAGILDALHVNGYQDEHITVNLHVVQPRAYHRLGTIRTWTVKASDLRPYFNELEATEAEALGDNPTCRVGPECGYCSARHACETLQQAGMAAVAYTGYPVSAQLEGDALGLELLLLREAQATIKARLTGLEAHAEATIRDGGSVPGWAVEPGQTRTRWAAPTDEVLTLGDMLGIDLRKPPEPVTPAQAKKLGIDPAVISGYSETPTGALKLVESTKTIAAAVFSKRMN